jgi:hypothetical protein
MTQTEEEIMTEKNWFKTNKMEVIVAILIAIVSMATALVVWRINVVGSSSDDIVHMGLINAIKEQTYDNENWRLLYEEASYARDYSIYLAGVQVMEESGDAALSAQAANLRQYLLPSLQIISAPLGTEAKYLKTNGSYDLEKRLSDLEADIPELSTLDPQQKFDLAKSYYSQKRWESIGFVLLTFSLLWLTFTEISSKWMSSVSLLLGVGVFLTGLIWFIAVEAFFFMARGGVL